MGANKANAPVPSPFDAPVQPSIPFFAIGDIHGQQDKLTTLHAAILARADDPVIVCVGDYIDRGDQSAQVLQTLMDLSRQNGKKFICLIGNHERMCLQFLDDPRKYGQRWLHFGGLQTLASFGMGLRPDGSMTKTRDELVERMGEAMIAWLRALPPYWISGNIAVVHAGADPALPIGAQPSRNLVWGHLDFAQTPRTDGMWVVHGHTVVDQPQIRDGRISIDTGAYATGQLTAAHVVRDGVSFMTC